MKSNNDNYWLRSGFINIIQNFSGVFFGFANFYILVRLLNKHDFGIWTLFMSTTTILELVRSGLIQNAMIKFISSSEKSEHPKIISSGFTISGVLTLACILINTVAAYYLGVLWKSPEITIMLYLFNLIYLFSGILTQFNCVEQANFSFKGILVANVVRQSLFFVYVLFCLFWGTGGSLRSLVIVQIVATAASALVAYFYARDYLKVSFKLYPEWIKSLFNYGKYAFGTTVSSILSGTIDQMMLGAMMSPAASASFNIASRITNLLDIPTNAIATIVFPQSAKRIVTEGKDGIKYLYEKSVGTILAILVPGVLFLYFFSGYVISILAGGKYDDSIPLLKVMLLYSLLIPYGRQFGTILDSIGKTKLTFKIVLFSAILNLTLNYFFIKHFGTIGAPYASLLATVIGFGIAQVILKKEFGVSFTHTLIYSYRFYPEFYNKFIYPRIRRKPKQ